MSAFWHADNVKTKLPDRGTWTMDAKLAYGEGKTSNSIILPFHIGKNYDNMSSAQNGGYWGINILSKPVYPASELEIGRNDTVQRSIVDVVSYRAYDQVSDKRFLFLR
ncbi:hypothetical protein BOW53_15955 [Solemya pervernicosa gill symbiont]|uniref:Uncharacterized protein n=1 Tax=Solemya pervernicosa gill symbiont TaxID=642797 RepID=A0A1T2KZN8_9GAMM|nr:hypothetical protein BOW53_15955 [Solemya pervernicosa gill symbiont]